MINGNRGNGCNCTEQEHADFRLIRTHIRETARILRYSYLPKELEELSQVLSTFYRTDFF